MTNSKQKGKRGELELAHYLAQWGYDTRRGQQYCGANGDADVIGIPGLHIECKRTNSLRIHEALSQSKRDALPFEVPTVMHRRDNDEWLVTLPLKYFIEYFKSATEGRDE